MYCRNCGEEISEQSQFCKHCGEEQCQSPKTSGDEPFLAVEDFWPAVVDEISQIKGESLILHGTTKLGERILSAVSRFEDLCYTKIYYCDFTKVCSAVYQTIDDIKGLEVLWSGNYSIIVTKRRGLYTDYNHFVIAIREVAKDEVYLGILGGSVYRLDGYIVPKAGIKKSIDAIAEKVSEYLYELNVAAWSAAWMDVLSLERTDFQSGNTVNIGQEIRDIIISGADPGVEAICYLPFEKTYSDVIAAIEDTEGLELFDSKPNSVIAKGDMGTFRHDTYFLVSVFKHKENETFVGLIGGSAEYSTDTEGQIGTHIKTITEKLSHSFTPAAQQ